LAAHLSTLMAFIDKLHADAIHDVPSQN